MNMYYLPRFDELFAYNIMHVHEASKNDNGIKLSLKLSKQTMHSCLFRV